MTFKKNVYQLIFYQFHPKKYLQKQEAMDQTIHSIWRKTNSNNSIYVHRSKRNETIGVFTDHSKTVQMFNAKEEEQKKKLFYYISVKHL